MKTIIKQQPCNNKCKCITETEEGNSMNYGICTECKDTIWAETKKIEKQNKPKKIKKIEKIKESQNNTVIKNKKNNNIKINTIYNECATETMKRMSDKFVDFTFTSPPYNVTNIIGNNKKTSKYTTIEDNMSNDEYIEFHSKVISELLRVNKYYIFYNIQILSSNKIALLHIMNRFSSYIKDIIVWDKKHGAPALIQGVLNSRFELIIAFGEPNTGRRFINSKINRDTPNVIEFNSLKYKNIYSDIHNAVFSKYLVRKFMRTFGEENDIWYDPFGGTGTTAVAAIEEKKLYILSEIGTDYVDLSIKRIHNAIKNPELFT